MDFKELLKFFGGAVVRVTCVLLILAGCADTDGRGSGEPSTCAKPEDCGFGLTCSAVYLCATVESAACSDLDACRKWGRCTAVGNQCLAGTDADCRQSLSCSSGGACSAISGECLATSDDDCASSSACKDRGECHATGLDWCRVLSDADCQQSDGCKYQGKCIVRQGRCDTPCGTARTSETTLDACSNGLDDNGNGYTDCRDFTCLKSTDAKIRDYCEGDPETPEATPCVTERSFGKHR